MGGLDSASVFYPEKDSVHKSEPHTQLICLSPSLPFQDAVRQLGGILHDGEKVTEIKPGLPVKVKTTSRSYQAKSVVITAGPWTNRLLSTLGIQLPLRTLRINVCYWREKVPGSYGGSQAFPCFLSLGLDLAPHHIYGLPAGEYPGLVKSPSDHGGRQQKHTPLLTVCSARPSDVLSPGKGSPPFEDLTFLNTAANIGQVCYHHGNDADPEERDCPSAFSDNQDVQILCRFVRDHLPDLGPTPAIMEHCMYTNTPDKHFILDRHPKYNNIVIGAGFSGHGFKLSPVVGKILYELSMKLTPSYDLTPFRISRFPGLGKAHL
ncbi:peroxisomal sarcosine oxidase isoform 3-T3 [Dugong dugon]